MKDNGLIDYSNFFQSLNRVFESKSDSESILNNQIYIRLINNLNDLFKDKIKILSIERSPVTIYDAIISCLIINSNIIYNLNVDFDLIDKTCKKGNPYLEELIDKIENSLSLNFKKIEDQSFFKLDKRPLPKDLMKALTKIEDKETKDKTINKVMDKRKIYWNNGGDKINPDIRPIMSCSICGIFMNSWNMNSGMSWENQNDSRNGQW